MGRSGNPDAPSRRIEAVTRALFASPSIGVALTSPEKGWIDANETLCEMSGYGREELFRKSWVELSYPPDLPADLAQFDRLLRGEIDRYSLDKRFVRKDGSLLWTMITVSCVRKADGGVDFVIGLIQDITARKQAEEAHKQAEARFRQLASELPVAIYQTAAGGDITFVNPAWLEITGLTEAEAFSPEAGKVIHPDDREQVVARWDRAVASGSPFSGEYRLRTPAGRETWVKGFGTAVRDSTGRITSFVGALVDVSEIRRLHAELAQTARLAAMGTLVAGVAHEINNPLAATLANVGLVLELATRARDSARASRPGGGLGPGDWEQVVEALSEAQESGGRIAQVVKDMAAFASPGPARSRVRLADVVHGAMRWLPPVTGLPARIRVEDGGAPEVVAAPGQLEQVVHNLVTNAARASAATGGDIVVRIGPGSPGMARLEVIDRGVGIPEGAIDRIFEPFYTTRPAGQGRGAGLGLAISRTIVEAHGGTLTAASTVGKGSTFRMELPVASP
ncbi:MAG TPA: PAS domain S-box protein [Anaeromyxobacteraceae bacterium]|nr:PAS domain S-box protein [Anaeromyxobacteraceae bacterium]